MPADAPPPSGRRADDATGALIERLAGDLKPVRRRTAWRDAAVLAAIVAVELLLFLAMGGLRPDMPMAMKQPSWWWKLGSMGAIGIAGLGTALLSLDPARSPRRGLRITLLLVLLCVALGWLVDAARPGTAALLARLDWRQGIGCVWKMAVLAIPAVLGFGVRLRRGAPFDGAATSWAGGLGAAAAGAFVFVFACPSDDPLYIAAWYAVGLALVSAVSRVILGWVARW